MSTAAVVGSGPNGLAAAIELARAGVTVTVVEADNTIGGGMQSRELVEPGILHDECSAFHPMALSSPFFRSIDLEHHGLRFLQPEVQLAHPLDDGSSGALFRDVDTTSRRFGQDEASWRRTFGVFVEEYDRLTDDAMAPPLHLLKHPILFALFGANVAIPADLSRRRFRSSQAQAIFSGVAAHVFTRLDLPLSSSVGMLLTTAAQAVGWPVAQGGSTAIAAAMTAELESLGGTVITGARVTSRAQLAEITGARPAVTLLDTSPRAAAEILGDQLPRRQAAAYSRFRPGMAAFPIHFVVSEHIPWSAPVARSAGTVHVCGPAEEIAAAERQCARGEMPDRPFVLLGQQYLADPSRSCDGRYPIDAYAHVPAGYTGDATEAVISQIERFAPGFRDTIVGISVGSTTELERHNPNNIGGDIIGGHTGPLQLLARPILSPQPYRTGIPGVYLCSSSTPPGAGVHGMCGVNAASLALRELS